MPELPTGKTVVIGENSFEFSVAESAMELMTGLKGVTSLEPYHGMLFDFGTTMEVIMAPKGLVFPVEVAFITGEGEVLEIKVLDPNIGFTQASTRPVRYALEVPVGFCAENNIHIGDVINTL